MQDGGQEWRQNILFSNILALCNHVRRDRHQMDIASPLLMDSGGIAII